MSDSDDDWFNKDEEKLLHNLREHVKHQTDKESREEHINFCLAVQLSLQGNLDAKNHNRFTMSDLDKALKMDPLEMFLFFMSEHRDLFEGQLAPNDSRKRFSQYVEVLTKLCQLELPGFDDQLLDGFARQTVLLEYIKVYAFKVFTSASKGNLDAQAEEMLRNVKFLLIRAHMMGALQQSGYDLIDHFKALIANCQLPQVSKHPLCIELEQELKALPTVVDVKNEIYPKLDYLLGKEQVVSTMSDGPNDVASYIKFQRQLLYEDFALPLREFVHRLHSQDNIEELEEQCLLWPETKLVLNPEFAEAERNDLIYVDLLSKQRLIGSGKLSLTKKQLEYVINIKGGALLCFTTSYDFDNLILATVAYTNHHILRQGYINIEIAKQYNIGKIYGINLIMFQTLVFFEPYLRVHKYLSTCSVANFPMQEYIIGGQVNVRPPSYISPGVQLMYDTNHFTAANPPIQTKLNNSQLNAISDALCKEFCLIQGPPGTGKTHLSVELVNILIKNAGNLKLGPIILLTYTNDSLDKFLLKVERHTSSILRFGWQSRLPQTEKYNAHGMADDAELPPRLKRVWWMTKCEYKKQFDRLQTLHADFDGTDSDYLLIQSSLEKLQLIAEKINTLRTIFQFYIARDKALIAMTTTCAAKLNFLFRLLQSKCFIFEEAAEIAEPHILACLTPFTQHVILIGDHKQLQPHTGNHTKQALQISLFERLIANKFPASVLNVQYRMRSCIADLLVPTFYDNLTSDDSVKYYDNVSAMAANLYFVNHTRPEQKTVDLSFINQHEAKELLKLISNLKQKPNDIVVLSAYLAQVEYIKSLLAKKKVSDILVTTVDSYQGLEANIVLLSLVRSNTDGQIGFLRRPNRVCVALSRARWALYMIGNMTTLKKGNRDLWGVINAKLEAANAIGESFPLASTQ